MSRKRYPIYGTKTDYPKIEIWFRCRRTGNQWQYHMSTTWARTCRQAREHFSELPLCSVYGNDVQLQFRRAK